MCTRDRPAAGVSAGLQLGELQPCAHLGDARLPGPAGTGRDDPHGGHRVCPANGVSGGFHGGQSAAGMRSANVMAKAFNAGFQRMVHLVRPVPLGSMARVTM